MTHLEELRDTIRREHGVEPAYVESVAVNEVVEGTTAWEGVVEVFDLIGHPTAVRVYAWSHVTGDPANPKRHVTVLHSPPIKSAEDAVKAAILQEFRNREPAA
jgi:hypothetical protein